MSQDVLDVAIVGGGVSGCYCGYRLLAEGSASPTVQNMLKASERDSLSVALYEASDRIGGRLWTYRFPETPNLVADLGGMCFSPLHANVYGLCTEELQLAKEPAAEFSVYDLQYIRRHRFNFGDYCPDNPNSLPNDYYPRVVPYFLGKDEKWHIPTDLMLAAFKEAVPTSTALLDELRKEGGTPEKAWTLIAELRDLLKSACDSKSGVPIHDCGFWNLLSRHASQEAYDMALNSSGFYSTTENWNAYDTLLGCLVDFSVQQDWTKLKNGYDALPRELVRRFVARGGELNMRTRLVGLDIQGEGADGVVAMRLEANGATSTQLARNVILAMPQRSVRLLDPNTFFFRNKQFTDDLSTVTCEPATKLFLTFPQPWWRKVPTTSDRSGFIQCGQSATDLPIRLCYYLGSEENGRSLLLASFTDSIGVEYWNGYLPQSRSGLSNGPTREGPSRPIDPPSAMVRDAVRQLATMHGVDVPEPLSAAFVHWDQDPYGGGYHFWNTHLCSWEVMPRIRRPSPDANVFLCGEAFSAKQGWVEGAINTAEMTLETYFGLPRPGWAPKDYDFGP